MSIGKTFAHKAEAVKGSLMAGTGGEMLSAADCRAAPICRTCQIFTDIRRR
jgi:hypothetical protein